MVTLRKTWTRPLQKKILHFLLFSAAISKVNSLKRILFLLSSSYLEWQWSLGWAESALPNKSELAVGLFHCWMKQREKLNCSFSFSTCTENKSWLNQRALGFFRFAKWKIFTPKPSGNSSKWEELLTLCQPNLSAEFCSNQKLKFAFSWTP